MLDTDDARVKMRFCAELADAASHSAPMPQYLRLPVEQRSGQSIPTADAQVDICRYPLGAIAILDVAAGRKFGETID
jgi:hypothetical protein